MMVVEDEEQFVYFWIWIKCLIAFAIEKEYWVSQRETCLVSKKPIRNNAF